HIALNCVNVSQCSCNAFGTTHSLARFLFPPGVFATAGVQGMIVIRPFLGVLIGIVIALVIAAVVVIIVIRCKKHGRSKGAEKEQMEDKSMTLLKKDPDESVDLEEKGPDIIPATTVFSGYDAAHEKMVALTTGMDSYSAPLPLKESLESLGNHRTASPKKQDICSGGGGEVTYAELSFPKAVAVLPVQQGGTLRRAAAASAAAVAGPQLPEPPTEYARIDFHRTLRPGEHRLAPPLPLGPRGLPTKQSPQGHVHCSFVKI
ncbi:hypothetical protein V5799_030702, partial [Amblyomma americanum]